MESKIRNAPPGMGRLWDFACALLLKMYQILYESKAARRFRRIVTPNIRKLLQYAILLVFRFFVSLYHSARLPYCLERFAALFRPVIVYGCRKCSRTAVQWRLTPLLSETIRTNRDK